MKPKAKVHQCRIEGSSAVCFEREGEYWVKEYNDYENPEGRTYRVKFCPECGQCPELESAYQKAESLGEAFKRMARDAIGKPPLKISPDRLESNIDSEFISEDVRQYLVYQYERFIEDLKSPTTLMGFEHRKNCHGLSLSFVMEKVMGWREWIHKVPRLKFDSDWEVRVIPPFGGAIARFFIDKGESHVSVYLDCYDCLGCNYSPYWEIYPWENDTYRVRMEDTDQLLEQIRHSLNHQETQRNK